MDATLPAYLGDGRALTAAEVARLARMTGHIAGMQLAKLAAAGLVCTLKQGPHTYYRITPAAMAQLDADPRSGASPEGEPRSVQTGPTDLRLRRARTCYGHLAGRLGVAIADAFVARGHLILTPEGGDVTERGTRFFQTLGIDMSELQQRGLRAGGVLCRPCVDWSERRLHLGGALARALRNVSVENGWIECPAGTRSVVVTRAGSRFYADTLGVHLD